MQRWLMVVILSMTLAIGWWSVAAAAGSPASCTGHVASELAQSGDLVAANAHLREEARELGIPFGTFSRTIAQAHEGSFDACYEAFVGGE
jgi:hypothetical protein